MLSHLGSFLLHYTGQMKPSIHVTCLTRGGGGVWFNSMGFKHKKETLTEIILLCQNIAMSSDRSEEEAPVRTIALQWTPSTIGQPLFCATHSLGGAALSADSVAAPLLVSSLWSWAASSPSGFLQLQTVAPECTALIKE